jgi:hypothetical protein
MQNNSALTNDHFVKFSLFALKPCSFDRCLASLIIHKECHKKIALYSTFVSKISYLMIIQFQNMMGPSWSSSYGNWIYNYLCYQGLSPLTLWVRIPLRQGVLDTKLCDKVCQWLAAGRWFSPGIPVNFTNKTDRHDITEILLKAALNTITLSLTQNMLSMAKHQLLCRYFVNSIIISILEFNYWRLKNVCQTIPVFSDTLKVAQFPRLGSVSSIAL